MITLKRIATNSRNYTEYFCKESDLTELRQDYTDVQNGSRAYILGSRNYYEFDKSNHEWSLIETSNGNSGGGSSDDDGDIELTESFQMKRLYRDIVPMTEDFYMIQSHCVDDDGNWYVFYINTTTGKAHCKKFDSSHTLVSYETYNIDAHCNGCCYDSKNGYVYVLHSNNDEIYEIDTETLAINHTYHAENTVNDMSTSTKAIAYDVDRDKFYIGRVTGNSQGHCIYVYDGSLTYESMIDISDYGNLGVGTQDFAYHNNHIYMMSTKPSCIAKFDLTGKIVACYNLESLETSIREVEGIDYDYNGGRFTVSTTGQSCTAYRGYMNQFYECNYYPYAVQNAYLGNQESYGKKSPFTLYVDIDNAQNSKNPDGSSTNPFREIWEAIDVTSKYGANCRINVAYSSTYGYQGFSLHNGSSVFIETSGNSKPKVQCIHVSTNAYLYLKNIDVGGASGSVYTGTYKSLLEQNGKCTMQSCILTGDGSNKYAIYVNTCSDLMLTDVSWSNTKGALCSAGGKIFRSTWGIADTTPKYYKNNALGQIYPEYYKYKLLTTYVDVETNGTFAVDSQVNNYSAIDVILTYDNSFYYIKIDLQTQGMNKGTLHIGSNYCTISYDSANLLLTCTYNDITDLQYCGYNLYN